MSGGWLNAKLRCLHDRPHPNPAHPHDGRGAGGFFAGVGRVTALIKYEAARQALIEARTVDEIKDIHDKAEAMRAYARKAGDLEFAWWATELKLDAERKGGRLLTEMAETGQREVRGGDRKSKSQVAILKLEDLGLTLTQSSRWQLSGTVSDEDYRSWLDGLKGETFPTSDALRNLAKRQAAEEENGPHRTDSVSDLAALADSVEAGERDPIKTIYADPPWSFKVYSGKGKSRSAENHYDTMGQAGIEALSEHVSRLAAKDCALFLWAVMPQIPEALRVIEAWGFTYKTVGFTWIKQNKVGPGFKWGMGYWTRSNAEICMLATKGSPQRLAKDVEQLVIAPVGAHSAKPSIVQERIERLVPGPYFEMFGRRKCKGWTVWGNDPALQSGDLLDATLEAAQ